jgi:hypothetical protein
MVHGSREQQAGGELGNANVGGNIITAILPWSVATTDVKGNLEKVSLFPAEAAILGRAPSMRRREFASQAARDLRAVAFLAGASASRSRKPCARAASRAWERRFAAGPIPAAPSGPRFDGPLSLDGLSRIDFALIGTSE